MEDQGLYNASAYAGNLSDFVGKSNRKGLPFPISGEAVLDWFAVHYSRTVRGDFACD
jgi:hypothetical protein